MWRPGCGDGAGGGGCNGSHGVTCVRWGYVRLRLEASNVKEKYW